MSEIKVGFQKIEDEVVGGYKKIENKFTEKFLNEDGSMKTGAMGASVCKGYKKVEDIFVGGFAKVSDKCIGTLFAREGENVEAAKKRLRGEAE